MQVIEAIKLLKQMSSGKAAKMCGVDQSYISQIKHGVRKPSQKILDALSGDIKKEPYPDFEIKPFLIGKPTREEEDIVLCLADHHDGKITESYSAEVCKQRTDILLETTMKIINLHRPIKNAYVFDLGDNVQGENIHQGSKVGEVSDAVITQIYDFAIPRLSGFLASLAQGVEKVEFYGVPGNHGKYDKTAPRKTNWDNMLYKSLTHQIQNQKTITIHPPNSFYQLVNIRDWLFFLIHGDQVRNAAGGIPLFALKRKMQEWWAIWKFHYAYLGHWHSWASDSVNSHADYTICPPLVSGDEWALEVVGRISKPTQLCFGVHQHHGRTWEYKLACSKDTP